MMGRYSGYLSSVYTLVASQLTITPLAEVTASCDILAFPTGYREGDHSGKQAQGRACDAGKILR